MGHLEGSQASRFAQCADDQGKRMLVLSHHQLFSAYDERNEGTTPIAQALGDTLARRPVDVWFWGHEHYCLGYEKFGGVDAARVIGHGAVPTAPLTTPGTAVNGNPDVIKPNVDANAGAAQRAVKWEYHGTRTETDGTPREKHGFVVVDLEDDHLHAEYFDDEGQRFLAEDL